MIMAGCSRQNLSDPHRSDKFILRIRQNIVYTLIDPNIPKKLYEVELLTEYEMMQVGDLSRLPDREQLLEILRSKDFEELAKFINVVDQCTKGQDSILKILHQEYRNLGGICIESTAPTPTSPPCNETTPDDFNIGYEISGIKTLTNVIAEDAPALAIWNTVMRDFACKATDRSRIVGLLAKDDPYEAIRDSLQCWICKQSKNATFKALLQILKAHGLNNLIETLQEYKSEIWKENLENQKRKP